jgi:nucleotide-binding universal stress UspA family protein
MSFQNILVPYNGSTGAKKGFLIALELASKTCGKITIITCIEDQSILSFLKLKNSKKEFEREKSLIEKEFSRLKKDTDKLKIPFKYVVLKSSFAADTISEYAKSHKIDTVVLGKSLLKGKAEQYHESMANYLSSRITCPMIIVK